MAFLQYHCNNHLVNKINEAKQNVQKHFQRDVPNLYGKKGGPAHQSIIESITPKERVIFMSKQIDYYMDKMTEQDFIQYAYDNSFVFINWFDGTIVNPYEDKNISLFITRDIYLPFLKFRHGAVDVLNSLVIEYTRNNIIENKKIITGGRIYISDAYREKEYDLYMNDFIDDFNKLKKWIKVNVKNQFYTNNGIKQKGYITDAMLEYSVKEYSFQA